jgi:hypothetical protein
MKIINNIMNEIKNNLKDKIEQEKFFVIKSKSTNFPELNKSYGSSLKRINIRSKCLSPFININNNKNVKFLSKNIHSECISTKEPVPIKQYQDLENNQIKNLIFRENRNTSGIYK